MHRSAWRNWKVQRMHSNQKEMLICGAPGRPQPDRRVVHGPRVDALPLAPLSEPLVSQAQAAEFISRQLTVDIPAETHSTFQRMLSDNPCLHIDYQGLQNQGRIVYYHYMKAVVPSLRIWPIGSNILKSMDRTKLWRRGRARCRWSSGNRSVVKHGRLPGVSGFPGSGSL